MTSIIWGAFGLTMILIVVVGAMIQYTKDREKYKKTKLDEWNKAVDMAVIPKPKIPVISEPVTSFIKCFKDNPKRFKVCPSGRSDGEGWILRDSLAKKSWEFFTVEGWGRGCRVLTLCLRESGCQWLTLGERDAILAAMYPYFVTERRDRLHAIQRERLTRIYKESADV